MHCSCIVWQLTDNEQVKWLVCFERWLRRVQSRLTNVRAMCISHTQRVVQSNSGTRSFWMPRANWARCGLWVGRIGWSLQDACPARLGRDQSVRIATHHRIHKHTSTCEACWEYRNRCICICACISCSSWRLCCVRLQSAQGLLRRKTREETQQAEAAEDENESQQEHVVVWVRSVLFKISLMLTSSQTQWSFLASQIQIEKENSIGFALSCPFCVWVAFYERNRLLCQPVLKNLMKKLRENPEKSRACLCGISRMNFGRRKVTTEKPTRGGAGTPAAAPSISEAQLQEIFNQFVCKSRWACLRKAKSLIDHTLMFLGGVLHVRVCVQRKTSQMRWQWVNRKNWLQWLISLIDPVHLWLKQMEFQHYVSS